MTRQTDTVLQRLLDARRVSMKSLSEAIGRQPTFISDLMRRPQQKLRFADAKRISEVLGAPVEAFVGDDSRLRRQPADGLAQPPDTWVDAPAPIDEALLTACIESVEIELGDTDAPAMTPKQRAFLIATLYRLSVGSRAPKREDVIRLVRIAGG